MELTEFWIGRWKYFLDINEPITKRINVLPDPKKEIPKCLYKYYNLSLFSIDAIRKKYLYAASKFELNDDFDCLDQLIDMEDQPDDVLIDFYKRWHTIEEIYERIDFFRESFPLHKSIHYYGGFGVISLSDNIRSQTMWAHYANSSNGFAIKFNLENFNERMLGPFPVNYRKKWNPIKLIDVHEALAFLYMTNIKSTHWKYENEWRYIGVRQNMSFPFFDEEKDFIENRKFRYSQNAIEEILLGSRFFNKIVIENIEKKRLLIKPKHCKIYGTYKHDLLVLITDNKLKTCLMTPMEDRYTFELEPKLVEIDRIDDDLFEVKL